MLRDYIIKIEKWLIWAALIGIVFLLRHLFPMIFLTFILAYIGNRVLDRLSRRSRFRRINLIAMYIILIVLIVGAALLVVPRLFGEARNLARAYISHDAEAAKMQDKPVTPPPQPVLPRKSVPRNGKPPVTAPVTLPVTPVIQPEEQTVLDRETKRLADALMFQLLGKETFDSFQASDSYNSMLERIELSIAKFIPKIIDGVRIFVNGVFVVAFQFLLSIIFSFLILWDLPRLRESAAGFAKGRTAEIYEEIAPSLRAFAIMLGRAFEAQTFVAIINAILTSIGFTILGIPSIALLGTIVFFCSYIPVFGVILSTLPAALLAFKAGGLPMVGGLVVMILIVHAIEAYALNPLIYGRHMRLHPVAVLIVLLVGEHLFGVWGLLLAVPISAFVLKYVIEGESPAPREVRAA